MINGILGKRIQIRNVIELQKIINQALNGILDTDREDNAPVTSEDMEELTSLVIDSGDDVEDLDGLRYAVNLTSLSVYGDIAGLEEIGYLEKLESLLSTRIWKHLIRGYWTTRKKIKPGKAMETDVSLYMPYCE